MQATHRLDTIFAALADPTRRAILARLASGEASVTELAEPFAMSQPAISKHLKVLERAGLVSRGRDAQRRPRRLEPKRLREATKWLERYRRLWEGNYQRLDAMLERSEEHTSELQSRFDLVCRLLLEKKKTPVRRHAITAGVGAGIRESANPS